jgi:hypothetical protein
MKPASTIDRKPWASMARLLGLTIFALGVLLLSSTPVALASEACPNEAIRKTEAEHDSYASQLPDCRAYEQVSPVDKNTTDATGTPGFIESSPNGAIVSYTSVVPFPVATGSFEFPSYASVRGGGGWSTHGLNALSEPEAETSVRGITANGEETIVFVSPEEEERFLLAPGAEVGHGNAYVRNNVTGTYKLLAARPNKFRYAGSTPDGSHILFTSNTEHELVPGIVDETEVPYLYEWDRETGQTSFVGYVNGEVPAGGTVAGSNERASGELAETYVENVISENGSRIFFSEVNGAGRIYMREPNAVPPRTVEISQGSAQWRGATPDGSKVFYTEGEGAEENLHEYNVETDKRSAITEGTAGVLGVVGVSSNGSYAYFVAEGVLAANENHNSEHAEAGRANLYEWHEGASIVFVASLHYQEANVRAGENDDETDWLGYHHLNIGGSEEGYKGSRVSADGTRLLISSFAKLTSYDNAGFDELYLYDAVSGELGCVSCNPAGIPTVNNQEGSPATEETFLAGYYGPPYPELYVSTLTRNLSVEGTRVFFETDEALLPQANSQSNVYEWEQEGTGSCRSEEGVESGGCLYLISTGRSTDSSEFLDASANGDNVFFFTRQSLVGQDQDQNVDVYDARENGGFAAQNLQSSPPPCTGEACRSSEPASGPVFGVPYSATFSGSGNLAVSSPPPTSAPVASTPRPKSKPAKCKKGFTRKKNRCVKKSRSKEKAKKSAHADRRAGR